jgi:hypothetical protein
LFGGWEMTDKSFFETPADRDGLRHLIVTQMNKFNAESPADGYTPESAMYPYAALLVGSMMGCVHEGALAEALHFDADFVETVGARLRASAVWDGSDLSATARELLGDEHAGTSFSLLINVAMGHMQMDESGRFRITEAGIWHVETLRRT